ncbi:MAG: hypothetical protein V4641_00460, partial [Pseudomonadota bacterium]
MARVEAVVGHWRLAVRAVGLVAAGRHRRGALQRHLCAAETGHQLAAAIEAAQALGRRQEQRVA